MSGTIQVKRSANTSAPTALEFGELAWASNGQVLHIGREDSDTSNLVAGPVTPIPTLQLAKYDLSFATCKTVVPWFTAALPY